MSSPQTQAQTRRSHSHHDRSTNAKFTDYARKESGKIHSAHARMTVGGSSTTKRSKTNKIVSKSKNPNKDALTRLEDAAFTWCHNQLMPVIEEEPEPKQTPRSKWKTERLPERPGTRSTQCSSPIIITTSSNPCLPRGVDMDNNNDNDNNNDKVMIQSVPSDSSKVILQVVSTLAEEPADDSTPSTISASSSTASLDYIDDNDTYAFSIATNSIADGGTLDTTHRRLNKKIHNHKHNCINAAANVEGKKQPTTSKKSTKERPFVAPHEHAAMFCKDQCGKFCVTTEGMLKGMLYDSEHEKENHQGREDIHHSDPLKKESDSSGTHSTTSEETSSSSESFSESSENVEQVYSDPELQDSPPQRAKNRFSSLWKKSIKDRRQSAKTLSEREVEVDYPSYDHNDKQRRNSDVEVKLKVYDSEEVKEEKAEKSAAPRNTTFRPIASLRNLRQQKLEQEQQLQKQIDRSLRKLRQEKAGGEPYDEQHQMIEHKISVVQKDVGSDGMNHIGNGVDMKPSSRDTFHGRGANALADPGRLTRMQRLLEYNRRKLEEKKPFDENSSSVDVVDHHHNIKIVGKWKEEGEDNDSGLYSIADTPFMKKSNVYNRPREADIEAEKNLNALEEHLSFMKSRGSPVLPIQTATSSTTKQPVVAAKPTKQDGPTPPRPPGKMTNLERKLGKKAKSVQFHGVSNSSASSTNPYHDNNTVSCTSSQDVNSTNAVFFPLYMGETAAESGRNMFLKGDELGRVLPSSSPLFADIRDEERNGMGLNCDLD